jgi:hypothetical protein
MAYLAKLHVVQGRPLADSWIKSGFFQIESGTIPLADYPAAKS